MTAVMSVPIALAATLIGRRITPFGARQAGRAYAVARVENPSPIQVALVVWRDDDSYYERFFHTDEEAMLWATADACRRSLEMGR